MYTVSISEVLELNYILQKKGLDFKIHLRDACGSQSFWIEELNKEMAKEKQLLFYQTLEEFFEIRRIKIEYSEDKKNFWGRV